MISLLLSIVGCGQYRVQQTLHRNLNMCLKINLPFSWYMFGNVWVVAAPLRSRMCLFVIDMDTAPTLTPDTRNLILLLLYYNASWMGSTSASTR